MMSFEHFSSAMAETSAWFESQPTIVQKSILGKLDLYWTKNNCLSYDWKQQPRAKAMFVPQTWQKKDTVTPCFSVDVEKIVNFNLLSDLDKMRLYVKTLEEGLYWLW